MKSSASLTILLLSLVAGSRASAVVTGSFDEIALGTTTAGNYAGLYQLNSSLAIESGWGFRIMADALESANWAKDGGIYLEGNPVRVVLGAAGTTQNGKFEIWSALNANTANGPIFATDTALKTATFGGANVAINKVGTDGGNLSVANNLTVAGTVTSTGALSSAGSPVVTQASLKAQTNLIVGATSTGSTLGGVSLGTGTAAAGNYSFATGQNSVAWGTASVAMGNGNTVNGDYSVAMGGGTITNSGYALATGQGSRASGFASTAMGGGAIANGSFSFALGVGTDAEAAGSVSLGAFPTLPSGNLTIMDVPLDTLFSLGNGTGYTTATRSSAITTLKNGRTTLKNKLWVSSTPTATITDANASAGEALVVEGNTRLRGKVIIEAPQGDIAMGIYSTP